MKLQYYILSILIILLVVGCVSEKDQDASYTVSKEIADSELLLDFNQKDINSSYWAYFLTCDTCRTMDSIQSIFYFDFLDSINDPVNNKLDTFRNSWFSSYLYMFNEENLSKKFLNKETYRFTWLRTFHEPVVISISKTNNEVELNFKMSNGEGGYRFGELTHNTTMKLTEEKWEHFIKLIDDSKYWYLKTEYAIKNGFDGSEWILEGHKREGYHLVYRWCGYETRIGAPCKYLIELSSLEIEDELLY